MVMQNHAMVIIGLLSFLCFMSINISLTSGQVCSDIGNFTTNSTFGRNRDIVLSSLASNVRQNGGFYNTTIGEGPDKVYGLALCTAETTLDACFDCVNSAVEDIKEKCTNQKEAIKFGCIVRYSNRSFLGNLELTPMESDHNLQDITSNLTEFDQIWQGLMDHVATEASMVSSRLKMATGEANLTYLDKIYSIMQCTPDMSQRNCDFCLRQSMSYFQSCCHGKQGGYIQRPNCIFRWDLFPFYESIANAPPQSPLTDALPPLTGPVLPPLRLNKGSGGIGSVMIVIMVVSIVIFLLVVALACVLLQRKNLKQQIGPESDQEKKDGHEIDSNESLQFNFNAISAATNNFALDNKLGQGGFGIVYKGQLHDGRDIAVKRLSLNSRQGEREFKTESLLVAKLQHRNLVRLLGFCFQGTERLLIYEFVHNSSLDSFIFDPIKRLLLNWEIRYKIIQGIARGLLYLHEDSRLRIIHRDLKASNILLDRDLNPKISDFGLARLFDVDQTQCKTRRIVGTFGYMAPEYLTNGQFSVKSDVFSFGMLVLEVITGQKNNKAAESENLITYAWEKWRRGKALDLIDPTLTIGSRCEMLRCIHIALLCVQHNVADRPTMASVVLALTGASTSLPVPSKPAFLLHHTRDHYDSDLIAFQPKSKSTQFTVNEASITELDAR